jgi:hypothetical protein
LLDGSKGEAGCELPDIAVLVHQAFHQGIEGFYVWCENNHHVIPATRDVPTLLDRFLRVDPLEQCWHEFWSVAFQFQFNDESENLTQGTWCHDGDLCLDNFVIAQALYAPLKGRFVLKVFLWFAARLAAADVARICRRDQDWEIQS